MGLDLTGEARHERAPHYRRYLGREGRATVICVQDFDYQDYEASRFLDSQAFYSRDEAEQMPIDLTEMIIAATDRESAEQVLRNLSAMRKSSGETWWDW